MNDNNINVLDSEEQSAEELAGQIAQKERELALCNFRISLKQTNDFYLYTVILSAIIVAGGIVYSILYTVFTGLAIAILGVLTYVTLASALLYRKLGISYKSTSGALTVTQLYGQKRKDVWIPERLLWIEVTEIGDKAFNHASSSEIETVHLPATLKALGKDVFKGCQKLQRICFDGTREDFAKIECATDLSRYELIFRSEDAMTEGTQSAEQEGEEQ